MLHYFTASQRRRLWLVPPVAEGSLAANVVSVCGQSRRRRNSIPNGDCPHQKWPWWWWLHRITLKQCFSAVEQAAQKDCANVAVPSRSGSPVPSDKRYIFHWWDAIKICFWWRQLIALLLLRFLSFPLCPCSRLFGQLYTLLLLLLFPPLLLLQAAWQS